MDLADGEELLAGDVTQVVRVGDTVRRRAGPWTPAVHAVLRHLEAAGFEGAPRAMGFDRAGREVLSYAPGEVHRDAGPWLDDEALRCVGVFLRRYHDATRGFVLPAGVRWGHRGPVGSDATVICHNDVAPRNMVFRDGRPVALIDWDFAFPATPAWDLGNTVWQFLPITDDDGCRSRGWDTLPDRPGRLRLLVEAYGDPSIRLDQLVEWTTARMRSAATSIRARARTDAAYGKLVERGVSAAIWRDRAWLVAHGGELCGQ